MRKFEALNVTMNDWIEAYRKVALAFSERPPKTAAMEFIAFADTVARVMYDDIMRGEPGGTYYMDGRAVRIGIDHVYCVGGAYPTGIVLSKSEMESHVDVLAACELLREVIVQLQSDTDEPVGIGFWIDENNPDECWIDVSNLVDDEEDAIELMRKRGELAIFDMYTGREIRASLEPFDRERAAKEFSSWKRSTKPYRDEMARRQKR